VFRGWLAHLGHEAFAERPPGRPPERQPERLSE